MVSPKFPYPIESPTTAPFWEGLREGRLLLVRCQVCGRWYWPWSACREDHNAPYLENMAWEQASGNGRVFSFSHHLQQFHQDFPPPHVYGVVELEEGPILPTSFVGLGDEPDPAWVGTPVRATYRVVDDRLTVLEFAAVTT
jgi:uncharacterized OB-fold protein